MGRSRRDNTRRVNPTGKIRRDLAKVRNAEVVADLTRLLGVGVDNTDKVHALKFAINASVLLAEMANPYNQDLDWLKILWSPHSLHESPLRFSFGVSVGLLQSISRGRGVLRPSIELPRSTLLSLLSVAQELNQMLYDFDVWVEILQLAKRLAASDRRPKKEPLGLFKNLEILVAESLTFEPNAMQRTNPNRVPFDEHKRWNVLRDS